MVTSTPPLTFLGIGVRSIDAGKVSSSALVVLSLTRCAGSLVQIAKKLFWPLVIR